MRALLDKMKRSGLVTPCKKSVHWLGDRLTRISGSGPGRRLDRFTHDLVGFCRWVSQSLRELIRFRKDPTRRLLVIYDLSTQPFSIGDILLIQEASLVVRQEHDLGQVDFVLLYDPAKPTCEDAAFSAINSDNVLYHLASVLPAAQVNPHHGSLFLFNSPAQLKGFIADNADRYHVWPSAWRTSMGEYNYRHVFNELLHNHFLKHQSLPRLTCRQHLADWARQFQMDHVQPGVPVTVQVRNNKTMCPRRNLRLECWLDFFKDCEAKYPARFVIIGARAEMDDRLRGLPNVVLAKDYGTTIEQDLALIQTSAIHMGATSGPGMLAVFNSRPYLFVNSHAHEVGHDDLVPSNGMWRFRFGTQYQHFAEPPETVEMLVNEFARMWATVDVTAWQHASGELAGAVPESWLR